MNAKLIKLFIGFGALLLAGKVNATLVNFTLEGAVTT